MLVYISGQSFTKSKDAVCEIFALYIKCEPIQPMISKSQPLVDSDSLKTRSTKTREKLYKQLKINDIHTAT